MPSGKPRELAADGLYLRGSVEPEHATEELRVMFLQRLGTLDAPQRHQQEGQQRGAQSVEGRSDLAVDLGCNLEDAAGRQQRHRAQYPRTRHGPAAGE